MDKLQVNYEEIKVDIEDLLILRDSQINEKVDMPQIRVKRDVVNSVEELMNQYEACLTDMFIYDTCLYFVHDFRKCTQCLVEYVGISRTLNGELKTLSEQLAVSLRIL